MPLLNPHTFPPGGFDYFEPSINWRPPTRGQSLAQVTRQLQTARAQNPFAGLDPSYEACWTSIETYTCARLHNNPRHCTRTAAQAKAAREARKAIGCVTCGKKKR